MLESPPDGQISDSRSDLEFDGQIRRDLTVPSPDLDVTSKDPTPSSLMQSRSQIGSLRSDLARDPRRRSQDPMDPVALPLDPSLSRSFKKKHPPPSIIAGTVHPPPSIFNDRRASPPSIHNRLLHYLPFDEADRLGLCRTDAIPNLYKKQSSPAAGIATHSLQSSIPASSSSPTASLQESSGVYPGWRIPVSSRTLKSPILVAELENKLREGVGAIDEVEWGRIPPALKLDLQVKFKFSTTYSRAGLLFCDPEIVEFEDDE